jgi:hypothetical protein
MTTELSKLTLKEIMEDLADDKPTPITVQKEAAKRLAEIINGGVPINLPVISQEQKKDMEEREKRQNAPKSYSQIQLISVPDHYRQDYPQLFQIINRKGDSNKNKTIELEVNKQKIVWNTQINKAHTKAIKSQPLIENEIIKNNYKLEEYNPKEEVTNFENLRFEVLLTFNDKMKLKFEFYDMQNGIAQYLYIE